MKYNNEDLEKAKLYEIIDAGIDPRENIIFQMLFSKKGNEDLLQDFLEKLLKRKIKKLEVANEVSLDVDDVREKVGRIDIKAVIDEEIICDIEMQVKEDKLILKRTTYYAAKLIAEQLKKGDIYNKLKPVMQISILDKSLMKEEKDYILEGITVLKNNRNKELNSNCKVCYIELEKFRDKKIEEYNEFDMWLAFLDAKRNKEGVKRAVEENEKIKKAVLICHELTGSARAKRVRELNEKWRKDFLTEEYTRGEEVGEAKGRAEGKAEGIAEGKAEGIAEGKAKGKTEERIKIIKKLLKSGMNIEKISSLIDMPVSKVKKISLL